MQTQSERNFELAKNEIKSIPLYDWFQMGHVQFIYLFICPAVRRFKIGITSDVARRLRQISRPYEKYGNKWDCLGVLVVDGIHGAEIENYFHSMFRLAFDSSGLDEPYRSQEIYSFDTSVDFVAKYFFRLVRHLTKRAADLAVRPAQLDESILEFFTVSEADTPPPPSR